MKYYLVTCARGHCGNGKSIELSFAFKAKNLLDATKEARQMPAIKHTRGVLHAKEISIEEYTARMQISAYYK